MGFAKDYLPRYTVKDCESWEGDWELIEGIPYTLASPSFKLQRIVERIFRFLSVLRPDVMMVCSQREEKVARTAEVIFEVVSPSTAEKDERLKYLIYEKDQSLRAQGGKFRTVLDAGNEVLSFEVKGCSLKLDLSRIWEW